MSRLEVLNKVSEIEKNHCGPCQLPYKNQNSNSCTLHCDIGKELKSLGDKLLEPGENHTKNIMSKGNDMTTNDILTLVKKGVSQKELAKALGVGTGKVRELISKISEGMEMSKNMQEVKRLSEQGVKPKDIAEKLNLGVSTVYRYRTENNRIDQGSTDNSNKNTSEDYEILKLKYNSAIADNEILEQQNTGLKERNDSIRTELNELEDKYKKKNEEIEALKQENDELHNECSNLSKSIGERLSEHVSKVESLKKEMSELRSKQEIAEHENECLLTENSELKLREAKFLDKTGEDLQTIHDKYKTEKKKHETLFKYVTIASGSV